jgi:hypothetical protein
MSTPEPEPDLSPLVASAERILADAWGGPVRLDAGDRQGGTRWRSTVLRLRVLEGPDGAPETVILKSFEGKSDEKFDPAETKPWGPAGRFFREWSATLFLNRLPDQPPLCARLYGADAERGFILLEDLGDGAALSDHLTGSDAAAAESAALAYAAGMGRLHAATAGHAAGLSTLRAELAPHMEWPPDIGPSARDWQDEDLPKFREGLAALEVTPAAGFDAETAEVARLLNMPGPFLAFAPGDTCPDNHRLFPDGVRFFDFEFSEFRHALLDGAYPVVPFPTCWCVSRFPEGLPRRMVAAYRDELVKGCPEAADDTRFVPSLAAATAAWAITSVGWSLAKALETDERWGISTIRQRHVHRMETFAALSAETDCFPAIGETCREAATRLRERWGEEGEMPLYPPWRSPAPEAASPE